MITLSQEQKKDYFKWLRTKNRPGIPPASAPEWVKEFINHLKQNE